MSLGIHIGLSATNVTLKTDFSYTNISTLDFMKDGSEKILYNEHVSAILNALLFHVKRRI